MRVRPEPPSRARTPPRAAARNPGLISPNRPRQSPSRGCASRLASAGGRRLKSIFCPPAYSLRERETGGARERLNAREAGDAIERSLGGWVGGGRESGRAREREREIERGLGRRGIPSKRGERERGREGGREGGTGREREAGRRGTE